jgi:excisionase family DNA binding protein
MRTSRKKRPDRDVGTATAPVKLKVVEILEAATELLTIAQVARLLKVSPKLIYKMVAAGKLPANRIAGSLRLDPNALIAWLNQNQTAKLVSSSPMPPQNAPSAPGVSLERLG